MVSGYVDFEFDLPRFLLMGLSEQMDAIDSAQLTKENLYVIPEAQGVYQLFLDNRLVYIGKSDAETGLNHRLTRHFSHLQQRLNLKPERISFKSARVFVFTAVDLETLLISHYSNKAKAAGESRVLAWQSSGFGSNDPGRRRDTSGYKKGHFDTSYPINIDWPIDIDLTNATTAAEVLTALKGHLPYTFRFQGKAPGSTTPHKDLRGKKVMLPDCIPLTARSIIQHVVGHLPTGWRATKLPGRIILYKNDNFTYPVAEDIVQSP